MPEINYTVMLKIQLTISLSLLLTSFSFSQQADEVIGKYHLPNKLDIEIYEYNGKYFGKIIALNGYENGQTKDINNPDPSQREDPLIGKVIIKNLEYDRKGKKWENGSMYGPEKGMVFNLKVTEVKQNEIVVVGSKLIFWKTLEWEKI